MASGVALWAVGRFCTRLSGAGGRDRWGVRTLLARGVALLVVGGCPALVVMAGGGNRRAGGRCRFQGAAGEWGTEVAVGLGRATRGRGTGGL